MTQLIGHTDRIIEGVLRNCLMDFMRIQQWLHKEENINEW